MRPPAALVAAAVASIAASCAMPRYIEQAARGQLELMRTARPIDDVIADPDTPEVTRRLLAEVPGITDFGRRHGLKVDGSYREYVELERGAAVWFVNASKPLAFEPRSWCFPIVGCFPGLGWFELADAVEFRDRLTRDGWDAYLRGAGAFSTGGWFDDPIVSTMLSDGDEAMGDLVNVVLHELMHVTVLVDDQGFFNESIASFVADRMTPQYLRERFGDGSVELEAYLASDAEYQGQSARLAAAYQELDALYRSERSDADKLARKREVLAGLESDLRLVRPPNNASLIGYRTYNVGFAEFERLLEACGGEWPRFLRAIHTLDDRAFSSELQEDIGPVILPLVDARCPETRGRPDTST